MRLQERDVVDRAKRAHLHPAECERGPPPGVASGTRGEARQAGRVAQGTRLRRGAGGDAEHGAPGRDSSGRHLVGQGSRGQPPDQGARPEGSVQSDPGGDRAGERQEARRPTGGDRTDQGRGSRDPGAVPELPRLMARSTAPRVAGRLAPALVAVVAATTAGAVAAASVPTEPSAGGGATAFAAALADLPAEMLSADGAVLYYTDRALAWQRLGVGAETADRLAAVGRTIEDATYSQPPMLFTPDVDLDRSREEVGFTTFDIDREAAVLAPPRRVVVADTTVTSDAV